MRLNDGHISFIIKDLHSRGIILEGFQDEVVDHVCSAVEERMKQGERFADAYQQVIKAFGNTKGLQKTQKETSAIAGKNKLLMIRNYLTIAYRQILKGKLYSAVNTITLTIGIASSLLIALYVINELSYDRWNTNADRLYRVDLEIKFNENHVRLATAPAPFASTMEKDFPEVESTVRFANLSSYLVRREGTVENTRENHVIWADSTFFKIFPVPVLQGNSVKALTEAGSIAISRKMAEKYFPEGDPLGKGLTLDNKYTGKVTAVYENIPSASHFHFDIIIGFVGDWPMQKSALSTAFINENFNTYVLLREDTDAAALNEKLEAFVTKYVGATIAEALGDDFSMEKFIAAGNIYRAALRPVTDIHLHSDMIAELETNSSVVYVYLLEAIAILILAIACVNFMNLSTARSTRRAREVGVRKAMGSLRGHLIRLFLTESIVLSFISFAAAILLAWMLLPLFNGLSSKELSLPLSSMSFYGWVCVSALAIGTLAGLYPALVISSFKTSDVLKGRSISFGGNAVRSGLVIFQFVISILLIVGTITVNRQLNYIQNKKLGFDRTHVVVVKNGYALRPNAESFKTEALRVAGIENGSMSGHLPVDNMDAYRSANSFWNEGKSPNPEELVNLQSWKVDEDYVSTFGMEIIEGRGFSKEHGADQQSVVLNETAARLLGLGKDAIGKRIQTFKDVKGGIDKDSTNTYTVIGIVRDFHFSSMKENIRGVVLSLGYSDGNFSFKFQGSQTKEVLEGLEKAWKGISPGQPFEYAFLDEQFGEMYATEQRLGYIFEVFATLAIIIACLGLFALTAFAAELRTKEIGIRKVLGASIPSIVMLLSKEFGKLIFISFVVAAPLAWYLVGWWLTGYSYKTEIGIWVYGLAGLIIAVIALVTMSFQSIKAAVADPVNALRSE